ncbi:hypothetical protein NUW58_g2343 [Xylaria curta]|uniref:Uncharacterized protein n=1 Tax=Xylaria curta TaxID=42375 RepID=A0ACC1PJ88_9PEZI|nr:hypothetical protein NUW58_g2343 [Xylaria curta]
MAGPQQHEQSNSYYYFPSPETIPSHDEADEETEQVYHPPPPQTTHYWTSDHTRRLEYAAIDAASRGIKGWVMKHVVPDCLVPKDNRRLAFDDDTGSVRRYRLELECDDASIKEGKRPGPGPGPTKYPVNHRKEYIMEDLIAFLQGNPAAAQALRELCSTPGGVHERVRQAELQRIKEIKIYPMYSVFTNKPIEGFPETVGEMDQLSGELDLSYRLVSLDQKRGGTLEEKRTYLKFYTGVPVYDAGSRQIDTAEEESRELESAGVDSNTLKLGD